MNCADFDELLAQRLAGNIAPGEQERLAGHLRRCPACSAKAAEFERLREDFSSLREAYERVTPPFVFVPGDAEDRQRPARGHVFVRARAALAAAAVLAVAIVLWEPRGELRQPPPTASPESGPIVNVTTATPVRRTPLVWPGSKRGRRSADVFVIGVPTLRTPESQAYRTTSAFRVKTPTLTIQRRRLRYDDEPQSRRDKRDAQPGSSWADARLG